MKIANEIKVGALALVAILILIFGYSFLRGKNIFSGQTSYLTVFENVNGLIEATPITINGYQVGIVESIYLKEDGSGQIMVEMLVDDEVRIPRNSIVELVSVSLLGDMGLQIANEQALSYQEVAQKGINFYEAGDTIPTRIVPAITDKIADQIQPISDNATIVLNNLDTTLTSINRLLATGKIEELLDNLANSSRSANTALLNVNALTSEAGTAISNFNQQSLPRINKVVVNTEQITEELQRNTIALRRILGNVDKVTAEVSEIEIKQTLDKSIRNLNATLESANDAIAAINDVARQVDGGEGSLGKLINDEDLYFNLERASDNLNRLFLDLRANPKDFVGFSLINFGGKKRANTIYKEENQIQDNYYDNKTVTPISTDTIIVD